MENLECSTRVKGGRRNKIVFVDALDTLDEVQQYNQVCSKHLKKLGQLLGLRKFPKGE